MNRKELIAKAEAISALLDDCTHVERETILELAEKLDQHDRRMAMAARAKPIKKQPVTADDFE